MKMLLQLLFLFLLPFTAFAQRPITQLKAMPSRSLELPVSLAKAVSDTIFPGFVNDTCFTNPNKGITAYFDENEAFEGFLTGSNTYSDYEKLQRFVYTETQNFQITEVITTFFEIGAETINDGYLFAVVYDELDASGNLDAPLGTSDTVLLEDIDLEDFISFTFSNPVEVSNDSFFVGINLTGVYNDVADTTGYIGVASTYFNCGDGTNVLEIYPIGTQLYYDTFYESWGVNLELFMATIIETETTSARQPIADYAASIAPNPATETVTVRFNAGQPGRYGASLTDLNGRQLRQQVIEGGNRNSQMDWPVGDLPAGMYLFHVDGPAGRQSGKLMVH
ncbi:putative secreted protein (Por secretion system target) [Neolewinella xylanilytica]|uniref:Putative secreted protein (Por secretion system target) n=2 Tax=Neolewinella xylanilytica TaxID=1514080 RepID=A0A2S6I651_9BACT|nr:putative secreted protein (Por secretion system target) [Neolewinella xylanilytica]